MATNDQAESFWPGTGDGNGSHGGCRSGIHGQFPDRQHHQIKIKTPHCCRCCGIQCRSRTSQRAEHDFILKPRSNCTSSCLGTYCHHGVRRTIQENIIHTIVITTSTCWCHRNVVWPSSCFCIHRIPHWCG